MAPVPARLDAHQKPPEQMRDLFKRYQKASKPDLDDDISILDPHSPSGSASEGLRECGSIPSTERLRALEHLCSEQTLIADHLHQLASQDDARVYEVQALPGITITPSLLSPAMQTELLNRLLHRDLVNPHHKTNLHLHYDMSTGDSAATSNGPTPSPQSLFRTALTTTFQPKDPHLHKELSLTRLLEKKLRWITLGGQYDWTSKEYPRERPPPFPSDVAGVLRTLFPCVTPQAAILNLYSPGDTLSVHRDVSEECDSGLVSLSFGCEAVFIVGNEDGTKTATIRLRSGDALLMSRPSRFAWHAVPKVLAGTCPDWLQDWPMVGEGGSNYAQWKGWMAGKRINLNVRQMREQDK